MVSKKALKVYTEGRRPVERRRERWLDVVGTDIQRIFKCRNWRGSAKDRDAWRRRIVEAKAQVEV
jgi:hypothetical protein